MILQKISDKFERMFSEFKIAPRINKLETFTNDVHKKSSDFQLILTIYVLSSFYVKKGKKMK